VTGRRTELRPGAGVPDRRGGTELRVRWRDGRRALARSRFARVAALPSRLATVVRHDAAVVGTSARWLVRSREHTNFTYDLTALSREHLAWFVSEVCRVPVNRVRAYFAELDADDGLRTHIERRSASAARRGLADSAARYGRRIGWYAMVRARGPRLVVETGIDKGLGTCVLASALLRNAEEGRPGRLLSIDVNPDAGYLVAGSPWSCVVDLVTDDSLRALPQIAGPVDLFVHDSDHAPRHEAAELDAIEPHMAPDGVLLSDNATVTNVLAEHAEATGRRFLAFRETPAGHWFPGEGIGAAW
jgi:predicted O-methyltransferase YrrM